MNTKIKALLISLGTYYLFFFKTISADWVVGGGDAEKYFYPIRSYLYESLLNGRFPFWTERIFAGYPIYAAAETFYLNPFNILTTIIFGGFTSYKVLHLVTYLIGSYSLYKLMSSYKLNLQSFFVSNLVFYFSFFAIYHQQHFGMLLTIYLLPTFVYLTHKIINDPISDKNYYFLALLFAHIFTIGAFQSVFIIMMFITVYVFVFTISNKKKVFTRLAYFLFLGIIISLPQLIPSMQLYLNSSRGQLGVTYIEGSFSPIMIVNYIFPFFFSTGDSYKWNIVSDSFLIHETYIYIGISALILALVGFQTSKNKLFKKVTIITFILVTLLAFINAIPIFNKYLIPPFSLFRYWGRSIVLVNFIVAILAGVGVHELENLKLVKITKPIVYLGISFITLSIISLFQNDLTLKTLNQIKAKAFVFNDMFWIWFLILTATLITISIVKNKKLKIVLVTMLVVIDLGTFGFNVLSNYIVKKDTLTGVNLINTDEFINQRIAIIDGSRNGNKNLYYRNFGVLGYSQFVLKNYDMYLKDYNIQSSKEFNNNMTSDFYQGLKVVYAQNFKQNIVDNVETNNSDIKQLYEGKAVYYLETSMDQKFETDIINYPGWKLYINGIENNTYNSDNLFIAVDLKKGTNTIVLEYEPTAFYYGVLASIIGMLFWILGKKYYINKL